MIFFFLISLIHLNPFLSLGLKCVGQLFAIEGGFGILLCNILEVESLFY